MSKTLVYAGASSVLNLGLGPDEFGFSETVARVLDMQLEKVAVPGASNNFLLRSLKEKITSSRPDFLIVTWQTWEREEWQHQGQWYQINASGLTNLPKELVEQYQKWIVNQDKNLLDIKGKQWQNLIWDFHQQLIQQNIPHLFYNEMYPFNDNYKLNWKTNFIGPYDRNSSCYWYLTDVKKCKSDSWYHFGSEAHQFWAEFLLQYIDNNNLI